MSGILERIESKLDQLLAAQAVHVQTPQQSMGLTPTPTPAPTPTPTPAADPLAFTPPAATAVTNDMITALIQPHLANPAIKAAMQGVLAQMNIPGLPQAREDQYPALYQAFQAIIQQATAPQPAAAGNTGAPPATAGGMSIL